MPLDELTQSAERKHVDAAAAAPLDDGARSDAFLDKLGLRDKTGKQAPLGQKVWFELVSHFSGTRDDPTALDRATEAFKSDPKLVKWALAEVERKMVERGPGAPLEAFDGPPLLDSRGRRTAAGEALFEHLVAQHYVGMSAGYESDSWDEEAELVSAAVVRATERERRRLAGERQARLARQARAAVRPLRRLPLPRPLVRRVVHDGARASGPTRVLVGSAVSSRDGPPGRNRPRPQARDDDDPHDRVARPARRASRRGGAR